ncbi:hypothetical protein HaLaN_30332 [Haematococcus lacustris]|uniref:Uncharacterized protein n=1 Tax=Haematococcus lacustris TaxID=44745 RepID=A0A6A0AF89_HAELA|nr:hypothetical protein HaLaN_30332 [Haematococcus lacustris]
MTSSLSAWVRSKTAGSAVGQSAHQPPAAASHAASHAAVCHHKTVGGTPGSIKSASVCVQDLLQPGQLAHSTSPAQKELAAAPRCSRCCPLGCSPGAAGAAPQPPPHQGVAAPLVTEEENESLTAAASPFIDPLGELAEQEHGWQAEHLEAIKAGKDGKVVISCDWSEKLTVECRIEIMSEHWHAPQIGILVACAYFKNKEGAYMKQTVYVMTDGKEQSAAITQATVNQVVYYLLAEHDMDMRQLAVQGHPSHATALGMAQSFSVTVWWSYGATTHFKGRHDSEGGVVKQWLRVEILADRAGM